MFNWVAGRMRCFGGRHERSEKHIERPENDEHFVSKCRFCGTPLRRRAKRDWVVISRAEYRDARRSATGRSVLAP